MTHAIIPPYLLARIAAAKSPRWARPAAGGTRDAGRPARVPAAALAHAPVDRRAGNARLRERPRRPTARSPTRRQLEQLPGIARARGRRSRHRRRRRRRGVRRPRRDVRLLLGCLPAQRHRRRRRAAARDRPLRPRLRQRVLERRAHGVRRRRRRGVRRLHRLAQRHRARADARRHRVRGRARCTRASPARSTSRSPTCSAR